MTRLTNAFSKKFENYWAALCLHFVLQFLPRSQAASVTPAMEAGITDHVWIIEELLVQAERKLLLSQSP